MTIIAIRDRIMAADTVGWMNGEILIPVRPKIVRLSDGTLIGCAGYSGDIERARQWLVHGGDKPSDLIDFAAVHLRSDGTVWTCSQNLQFYQVLGDFLAIGAPSSFAMGALHAGASAEQAVRLCIAYTDSAGGDVQVEYGLDALP